MAYRMQQRRGTASQWTTADPILAAGELGYETDTGYFKIGDGTNVWSDLSYFKDLGDLAGSFDDYILLTQKGAADGVATLDSNAQIPISQLSNLIQDAPTSLDTLNEIATAVSDPSGVVQVKIDSAISTEVTNRNNAIDNSIENSILVGTGLDKSFDAETKKVTISAGSSLATDTEVATAVSDHNSDTSNVHGIADTSALATKTYADSAVSTHEADTTNVHGIADTSALATKTYADGKASDAQGAAATALSNHEADTTNIHGIADTTALATKTYADSAVSTAVSGLTKSSVGLGNVDNTTDANKPVSTATQTALDLKAPIANPTFTGTVSGVTKSMVGLGNVDNTTDANKPVSSATQTALDLKANLAAPTFTGNVVLPSTTSIGNVSATEIGYVDGVTSSIQTQINAKAPLASPTFTGTVNAEALTLSGNLTVQGTTTTVSSTNLELTDSLIYLAAQQYSADAVDIGIYGAYGTSGNNSGNHPHTGLIRDASDGKWKLISGGSEPASNIVDFTSVTYDTLKVGAVEATSANIGNVSNTELQYLDGVTSNIQTQLNDKRSSSTPLNTTDIEDLVILSTIAGFGDSLVFLGSNGWGVAPRLGDGGIGNSISINDLTMWGGSTVDATDAPASLSFINGAKLGITSTGSIDANGTDISATELSYLNNISSNIQTQLNNKLASATASSTYETITNVALKAPKASPSFTGGVTVDSSGIIFTDGTQVKAGVPSLTTINQQSSEYTPVLSDRDKLIEVNSASGVTVTIPANASVAYPVGTSFDLLQTGTGQITIAGAGGVTVNATPGLKLRTQWSSATLFKRATDTWVVYGDLTA